MNSSYFRVNGSAIPKTSLAGMSKCYIIANVADITLPTNSQFFSPDSGSSSRQFETQRLIYEANPSYVNPYSVAEGLPARPILLLAGTSEQQNVKSYQTATNDPTGTNVVRQSTVPDLPLSLQAILISLGETP
jgi:hypothetical protein